jgi:hypothetical protein
MVGSSIITLFEKSSPHPFIAHNHFYVFTYISWNKRNIVEDRGEGPELCWVDFEFLNKE